MLSDFLVLTSERIFFLCFECVLFLTMFFVSVRNKMGNGLLKGLLLGGGIGLLVVGIPGGAFLWFVKGTEKDLFWLHLSAVELFLIIGCLWGQLNGFYWARKAQEKKGHFTLFLMVLYLFAAVALLMNAAIGRYYVYLLCVGFSMISLLLWGVWRLHKKG